MQTFENLNETSTPSAQASRMPDEVVRVFERDMQQAFLLLTGLERLIGGYGKKGTMLGTFKDKLGDMRSELATISTKMPIALSELDNQS